MASMRAMGEKARLLTHASVLNDLPDNELKVEVAKMSIAEVNQMLGVVPLTSMHRIRAELLSRMYDDCVQRDQWKDAIWYLNAFSDLDITERVNRLKDSTDKRRELIVAALDNPRIINLIRTATGLKIDEKKPFGEMKTDGFQPRAGMTMTAGTIKIEFVPNSDLVSADEIAFVQTIRRVITGTNSSERYKAAGLDKRETGKGTAVDRFGAKKYGFFGYEDSGQPSETVTKGWCKSADDKNPSTMSDSPEKVSGTDNTFEACAIAMSGKDTGRIYGCLVWGFTVDDNMVVKPKDHKFEVKTSSEYQAATKKWNEQAAGSGGQQAALPPAR
jgi:hypothetical protein